MSSEFPFLVTQILNLLLGYPLLSLVALFQLRRHRLGASIALWALVILVPYLGPLAFWLFASPQEAKTDNETRLVKEIL